MILLAGLDNGLRPVGMVQAVGPELGLQGNAVALAVMNATLAVFVQIIAGVELDAGTVGVNGHGAAGFHILHNGCGITP